MGFALEMFLRLRGAAGLDGHVTQDGQPLSSWPCNWLILEHVTQFRPMRHVPETLEEFLAKRSSLCPGCGATREVLTCRVCRLLLGERLPVKEGTTEESRGQKWK